MSTILEMAEIVRAGRFSAESKPVESSYTGRIADLYTKDRINDLCNLFDTTPSGLRCAIESVTVRR